MARFLKNRKDTLGEVPGTPIHIGTRKMEKTEMKLFVFDKEEYVETIIFSAEEIPENIDDKKVYWLNINGLHDIKLISDICNRFSVSPLEIEDILNTDQRPKVTEENNNLYLFFQVMDFRQKTQRVHGDQVSFVLGKNYLLTFQEKNEHFFDPVRERIRLKKGRVRSSGADYLAFTLIDILIDNYLLTIEHLGDETESLENEVLHYTRKETIEKIYRLKTNISFLRKNIWPLKEIMTFLNRKDSQLIHKNTLVYFNDLQDLTTQALEAVDIYHTMTNDFLSIYNTYTNNKANDIMKVLTIFASVFTPLSFIAGIYGTNFDNIPGIHSRSAFFVMMGFMGIIVLIMVWFFKKRNWW